jgi:GNAT superfamily N-acetyltransferase
MPSAHVVKRSEIVPSFRVEQVRGMFDVPNKTEIVHEWDVALPLEERPDWKIGLVVGQSGAGKSVIAREIFGDAYFHEAFEWDARAIVDCFPAELDGKEIVGALSSVGLSSPPHWLKRFAHLSNGQKFRAELARCLVLDADTVIFDEFTSVVDRDVAKICSVAIAKSVRRRQRPRFVALSCHYDIIEWLQPDWLYDVSAERFEWRMLRRHPEIRIAVHRCDRRAWTLFRGHHYLSRELNPTALCYLGLWQEKPVAFVATLPVFGKTRARRESRCVVLPDYQGAGIGNRFSAHIAELYVSQGFDYYSATSHPAFIHHRARSPLWKMIREPSRAPAQTAGKGARNIGVDFRKTQARGRLTASFRFVGSKK